MERVLNMIIRRVMNRLTRFGVDKGVDTIAARRKGVAPDANPKLTQQQNRDTKKRARQAMRMMRRFGKF